MQTISSPVVARAGKASDGFSRIAGRTGVLIGTWFLALFHDPVQAVGAIGSGQYGADLNWAGCSNSAVAGYRVYYGTNSGNYSNSNAVGNVLTNTVSGLFSGVTYYFAVTAYTTNGLESARSPAVSYVPGTPSVRIRAAPARQFVVTVSGLIGQTYNIQATPDFKAWTVIGTVTLGVGASADFTDTNAASFPKRFYRTLATP